MAGGHRPSHCFRGRGREHQASPQVNQPLANSGCYPSGLSRSYKVVTFRTTSTVTGSFRAAVTATNGELVAALYDGSFNPAQHGGPLPQANRGAAGRGERLHQLERASIGMPADAHTWSLVLFADAATAVEAAVSLTSNGTLSIEGQPLALLAEDLAEAPRAGLCKAIVASINGTPPYKFSATGSPSRPGH